MMTNPARLAMVTIDCSNPRGLAEFWSAVLDWPIAVADDQYAMLTGPDHAIAFGAIPDYQRPEWPNHGTKQFHFDLAVDDIEAAASRIVELGATRPAEQPGETWIVLLDPDGHPFCLTNAANWG
jgi:predicted enzyme related to lactoylglutathione lyase